MATAHKNLISELASVLVRHGRDSSEAASVGEKIGACHERQLSRLKSIVDAHGWPSTTMVGAAAASHAICLLPFSDGKFKRRVLPLLWALADSGEASALAVSLVEDQALLDERQPQMYGWVVQPSDEGDSSVLWPIADEANVDKRRASVGLQPLAEYLKRFGIEYKGIDGQD